MMHRWICSLLLAWWATSLATADDAQAGYAGFRTPTTWARGSSADSTYQEWNIFTSANATAPLNVPDQGLYSSPALPATHDVYDTSGTSFLTGGGNIYSPTGILDVDVVVPNYNHGAGGWTTILLQTVTLGSTLDLGSVQIVQGETTYHPLDSALLFSQVLGGIGGLQEDRWFEFHLPGNAASYLVEMTAGSSSLSFDKVAVDTIWTDAALPINEPNPVPEPAAGVLAAAAMGCMALFARRNRWQRSANEKL